VKFFLNLLFLLIGGSIHSQTIQGSFPLLANQKVKFGMFDG
jgi:hypothetical protein